MFLDGHDLNGVVAVLLDARQHVLGKLLVGAYLLSILSHADVALVDEQRVLLGLEVLLLPLVGLLRIPHLSREYLGLVVLYHAAAPGRNTLALAAVPLDLHLVELAVLQGFLGEFQLPVACALYALAAVFLVLLPVVEVANEVNIGGVRCPLAEHPAARQLVQSEVKVAGGKVGEFLLAVLRQLANLPEGVVVTAANGSLEGLQPGVVTYQADMRVFLCHHLLGGGLLGFRCCLFCRCHVAML